MDPTAVSELSKLTPWTLLLIVCIVLAQALFFVLRERSRSGGPSSPNGNGIKAAINGVMGMANEAINHSDDVERRICARMDDLATRNVTHDRCEERMDNAIAQRSIQFDALKESITELTAGQRRLHEKIDANGKQFNERIDTLIRELRNGRGS